jgi:hypothetical protein
MAYAKRQIARLLRFLPSPSQVRRVRVSNIASEFGHLAQDLISPRAASGGRGEPAAARATLQPPSTEAGSTLTPGPMVEETATRWT